MKSKCCTLPMRTEGKTTKYYVCNGCNKNCDAKPSEIFEGENSSLKKTFDKAVSPEQIKDPMTDPEADVEFTCPCGKTTDLAYIIKYEKKVLLQSLVVEAEGSKMPEKAKSLRNEYVLKDSIIYNKGIQQTIDRLNRLIESI